MTVHFLIKQSNIEKNKMENYYKHEWVEKVFETKNLINKIEDDPSK